MRNPEVGDLTEFMGDLVRLTAYHGHAIFVGQRLDPRLKPLGGEPVYLTTGHFDIIPAVLASKCCCDQVEWVKGGDIAGWGCMQCGCRFIHTMNMRWPDYDHYHLKPTYHAEVYAGDTLVSKQEYPCWRPQYTWHRHIRDGLRDRFGANPDCSRIEFYWCNQWDGSTGWHYDII